MSSPVRSSDSGIAETRVLYLVTNDISARFLRGQLAYLIERGYRVAVGTGLSDPPAAFDEGVATFDLPYEREPHVQADMIALWRTVQLIRAFRPDIVNASTPKAGLVGMVGAIACRVPKRVYVVRGLRFETAAGVRRVLLRLLERITSACATDVVFNSPSLMRVAERERTVRRGKGTVLGNGSGNGIDNEQFDDLPSKESARAFLGLDPNALVIGYVGRLTNDKGIADLVEAFRDVPPQTLILLVGEFEPGDPVSVETRQAIEQLPHFIRLPWTQDTRTAYRAMDVLVFPSYREGLPNVPLEAQLCDLPVVAYAATGTVDALAPGRGTALVEIGDRKRLRVTTLEMVGPTRGSNEVQTGREWVAERFDQRGLWAELDRLYRRVDEPSGQEDRPG